MMTVTQILDKYFYLLGDEDGDVGLQCRECDRGGLPVVHYSGAGSNPYPKTDVVFVMRIGRLLDAGLAHIREKHS